MTNRGAIALEIRKIPTIGGAMKLHAFLGVALAALLLNPLVFGSALPQAPARQLSASPLGSVQWSELVKADRLAPTPTVGTFRVVKKYSFPYAVPEELTA